jgi:hypothetical protein
MAKNRANMSVIPSAGHGGASPPVNCADEAYSSNIADMRCLAPTRTWRTRVNRECPLCRPGSQSSPFFSPPPQPLSRPTSGVISPSVRPERTRSDDCIASEMVASRTATPIADDILLAWSCQRQRTSQKMIFKPRRSHAPNRSLLRSNRPSADRNFRVNSPARWEPVIRAPGRTAGEPGNPSSAGRPPRGPRATKQRPFVRDGRRPPRGGTEAHRLGPSTSDNNR